MRLHAQTAMIENGFVFVPDEAPWLADYLSELTTFPAWVAGTTRSNSTAQALAWARAKRRTGGGGAWIEYYRRLGEPPPPEPMVRLLAPADGCSHVIGWSGRQYVVRDRWVEVEQGDAPPLLRAGFGKDV